MNRCWSCTRCWNFVLTGQKKRLSLCSVLESIINLTQEHFGFVPGAKILYTHDLYRFCS